MRVQLLIRVRIGVLKMPIALHCVECERLLLLVSGFSSYAGSCAGVSSVCA